MVKSGKADRNRNNGSLSLFQLFQFSIFAVMFGMFFFAQLSPPSLPTARRVEEMQNFDANRPKQQDKELLFQSALSSLSCFITPNCFPRYKCKKGQPERIKRKKTFEEMSFCIEDLQEHQVLPPAVPLSNHNHTQMKNEVKQCLVYSFGIERSTEWEHKMAQFFHCEVHAFDPTVNHQNTSYVTFHKLGLKGDGATKLTNAAQYNAIDPSLLLSLDDIMKRLGHEGRTIDVFMLDCEGCEWSVLHRFACSSTNAHLLVDQLLVEVHFQKSLGLATDDDVIMAGNAINCLRRDGWGMVTQEPAGCSPLDAHFTRGILEILPSPYFLMYTSLQRLPPESTPSLNSQYENWLQTRKPKERWSGQLAAIEKNSQFKAKERKTHKEKYSEFDERGFELDEVEFLSAASSSKSKFQKRSAMTRSMTKNLISRRVKPASEVIERSRATKKLSLFGTVSNRA